jgi:hypothetical protein
MYGISVTIMLDDSVSAESYGRSLGRYPPSSPPSILHFILLLLIFSGHVNHFQVFREVFPTLDRRQG